MTEDLSSAVNSVGASSARPKIDSQAATAASTEILRYPFLERPGQVLRDLRSRARVVQVTLWTGKRAWLAVRHADAIRALTDPRLSADMGDPNFPSMNPSQAVPHSRPPLSRTDNAPHREIRRLVVGDFTARMARKWQPVSEKIYADQLTTLLRNGPPADLMKDFAMPAPLRLICRMVGIPERDTNFVMHHAHTMTTRASATSDPSSQELFGYAERLVRDNEVKPGDGLIGQWVVEHLRTGAITRENLIRLAWFIIVAGHITTAATIGLSVLSLLEEPGRYRALHDGPAQVGRMVDEFLRFQTVTSDGNPRVAKRDLVLGGVAILAGDAVIISLSSANRDEEVFADPDSFQPHRANLHRHVALGWGPHRCLGQHIARMELRVALIALARTIPTLRLAVPTEQIHFDQRERHGKHVKELPVTW